MRRIAPAGAPNIVPAKRAIPIRRRMSCMSKPFTLSGTTDTRTLSTSEIVVVAVTVLGTLVAWLTGPHIPLPPLPHGVSGMACDAPASAVRSVMPLLSSR